MDFFFALFLGFFSVCSLVFALALWHLTKVLRAKEDELDSIYKEYDDLAADYDALFERLQKKRTQSKNREELVAQLRKDLEAKEEIIAVQTQEIGHLQGVNLEPEGCEDDKKVVAEEQGADDKTEVAEESLEHDKEDEEYEEVDAVTEEGLDEQADTEAKEDEQHVWEVVDEAELGTEKEEEQPVLVNAYGVTVEEARLFVRKVWETFQHQPDIYYEFGSTALGVQCGKIGDAEAADRIGKLFQGHPELIRGYNAFLPPELRVGENAR